MVSSINTSNYTIGENGQITFSGAASGIDWQKSVDAIIAAKRIPADKIETKIASNDIKALAYQDLKTKSSALSTALAKLEGGNFYQTEGDVFRSKTVYTTSAAAATAPADYTPLDPSLVMGVAVDADAEIGTHTIQVLQKATNHQLRSGAFAGKSTSMTDLGFSTGSMTIQGQNIDVSGSDTLYSIRDKINQLNSGSNATGVSASIVSVSDTEHYLVLNSTETGSANSISFGGDLAVHNDMGFTTAGTTDIANEIQAADDAILRVDGVATDIVRSSNTIDDVIDGVTIDVLRAEENTVVTVNIDQDYQSVKDAVVEFITAYNDLKTFIGDQNSEQIRDGDTEESFGPLAFDSVMRRVEAEMGAAVSFFSNGAEDGYKSLSQIGITTDENYLLEMDDSVFDNKLLTDVDAMRDLFSFRASSSDPRVSYFSHTSETKEYTDVDGNILNFYLNIDSTDANGNILAANVSTTMGAGTASNDSVTIEGNKITINEGYPGAGMTFLVTEASMGASENIAINFSRGIADNINKIFENEIVATSSGQIDVSITNIAEQKLDLETQVTRIDDRLAIQREKLTRQFLAMETALAQMETLQEQMKQQLAALNGNDD